MSSSNPASHERACINAIASIGGDPAMVQEMVTALKAMREAFLNSNRGLAKALELTDAILSKLPTPANTTTE